MSGASAHKQQLRAALRRARAALPAPQRQAAAQAAAARLQASELWPQLPARVGLYAAIHSELDPAPIAAALAARGAQLFFPRVDGPRLCWHACPPEALLRSTGYGIPEPPASAPQLPAAAIGAFFIPGLGFDDRGARLGYGAGFYDRALAGSAALRIGLCFDLQRIPALPEEPHDLRVHALLTERGLCWIDPAAAARLEADKASGPV